MMQIPFNRDYHFNNKEFSDSWIGAVGLWDTLKPSDKIFLLVKWKNDCDSLGPLYDGCRFSDDTLHKMYGYDIRIIAQDVLGEHLDGPITNSDGPEEG